MIRFVIIAMALIISVTSHAKEPETVPFLFSEDEKVEDAKDARIFETLKPADQIKNDEFLNQPVTKLDFALMKMEFYLQKTYDVSSIENVVYEFFEPARSHSYSMEPNTDIVVRYNDKLGKIIASVSLLNVGKPKRPMTEACKYFLSDTAITLPQELYGYIYHNTILSQLIRTNYKSYNSVAKTLAENIILKASVNSRSNDGNAMHIMSCWKETEDAEIKYEKASFKLR